ncbi:MAG: GIY-YIG nuclease family protein [Snowella sp.]|nr:GIY-YIG nuclease family protein [Snowella sp.]
MPLEDVDLFSLPYLELSQLGKLPSSSGIYFAIDSNNRILYVGQAKNILERWKNHHRKDQLLKIDKEYFIKIAWFLCQEKQLKTAEDYFIRTYTPLFNFTKIEYPNVIPSEVLVRELLEKIRLLIVVVGISPNTTGLKRVYLNYDYENNGIRGCAKTIKTFLKENKERTRNLKIVRTSFGKYMTQNTRPGSREHKVISRLKSSYNNHWEIFCNGTLIDITPISADEFLEFKEPYSFTWKKLAGIKVRAITQRWDGNLPMIDDPIPLFWSNP